jgi:hypothetical protein
MRIVECQVNFEVFGLDELKTATFLRLDKSYAKFFACERVCVCLHVCAFV